MIEFIAINLIIFTVMSLSFLAIGFWLSNFLEFGGSVARAKEARESMMRLTHNNYIDFKGESLKIAEPKKDTTRAKTLTVNWNCRNYLMFK